MRSLTALDKKTRASSVASEPKTQNYNNDFCERNYEVGPNVKQALDATVLKISSGPLMLLATSSLTDSRN